MLRGHDTNVFYEECLRKGLCKEHLKELQVKDAKKGPELQRKAMLFIRLQLFGPLVFDKPYSFEKMRVLFQKCRFFPTKESKEFPQAFMILDSVVVYTLCYLSSVCCAGVLYQSGTSKNSDDPDHQKIVEIVSKNVLQEDDISYFTPLLSKTFPKMDVNLIKMSLVTVLLYVRSMATTMKLDQALKRIDTDLINVSKESEKWKTIGMDALKAKRFDEAVDAFTSAINFNPYSVTLLTQRGQAYSAVGLHEKALVDRYLTLVIDPNAIAIYTDLCICLFKSKMFLYCIDIAVYVMEKFRMELDPRNFLELKVIKEACENNYRGNNEDIDELRNRLLAYGEDNSKQDVPDLIEASDSESETQDPDEDSEAEKKLRRRVKKRSETLEQTEPQEPVFKDAKEEKCYKLNLSLKEGSRQLLDGRGQLAIPCFHEALNEMRIYPEVYYYEECDVMSIRYAYGCALCKSKDYDDLMKAISVFKDIVEEHTANAFPAAYYGMALAYKKLNLYKEALNCLSLIPEILSRSPPLKVCNWPGLTVPIEETRPTHLMTVTTDLVQECENAPAPDATCRYEKCTLRSAIYISDLDFKGYYSVKCTEQCFLQYHTPCWKILRSLKQVTDKAFLEQECFTPDCEGVVCNVVCYSKEGEVEKTFSVADTKSLPKQKKQKTPKKAEVKEDKKRKTKDNSGKSEDNSGEILPETAERRETPETPLKSEMVQAEPSTDIPPIEQNGISVISSKLSVDAEPYIVLKKEKLEEDLPSKVPLKSKEHKKMKNTFSLDEFLESNQANNSCSEVEDQSKASLQNGFHPDFPPLNFSQISTKDEATMNGVPLFYEKPLEVSVVESMKKLIFDSMKNLLQKHGPLHMDDPIVTGELSAFPHAANRVIADAGGIGGLLKHNLNFAVVGDAVICTVSDVVAAYEKQSADLRYSTDDEPPRPNPGAEEFRRKSLVERSVFGSPKTSHPQQASDLLAKLAACLALLESEELDEFRPFVEESLRPFSVVPGKACAATQTDDQFLVKQEEEASKNKEEIDKLEKIIQDLTIYKKELEGKVELLEENLMDSLNCRQQCTNEIADFKTQIQNLTKSLSSQKEEFKEEWDVLTKENRILSDKLKISEAKEKGYKGQIEKFVKEVKSLQQQIDEHKKSGTESQKVLTEKDQQIDTLIQKMKTLTSEKDQLTGRAIYTEDLLLHMKKAETLKKINTRIAEASMRYKALQDTLKTLPLGFKRDAEILAAQIGKYLMWLYELRKAFNTQIDEQISKVRNGTPLSNLKPVDVPQLGEIPTGSFPTMATPPPLMFPPPVMPPPSVQIQPSMLSAQQERMQCAASDSPLPTTTSDLISRVQSQLAVHPSIVKPVAVHAKKAQAEEARGLAADLVETVKHQSVAASLRAISTPKLDQVGQTVQSPVPQTMPKTDKPAVKIQPAVSQVAFSNIPTALPKMEEPDKQIKGTVSQSTPRIEEVGKKIPVGAVSQENLRPELQNSYEKLLHKLQARFPQFTRPQLVGFVKEFRDKRHGKLSGLSMDVIVNDVSLLIQSKEAKKAAENAMKTKPKSVSLVNRNFAAVETKNKQQEGSSQEKCPAWGGGAPNSKTWSGGESAEEDCSICTEDMSKNAYKVACGHRFHSECIKAWLNKKSDCPICRVHLLLQEDYPALS